MATVANELVENQQNMCHFDDYRLLYKRRGIVDQGSQGVATVGNIISAHRAGPSFDRFSSPPTEEIGRGNDFGEEKFPWL